MAERKPIPQGLKLALDFGPLVVFFAAFFLLRDHPVTLGGETYGGFVLATAVFVPVLIASMAAHGGIFHQKDGLQMALAMCPPTPRRGVLLIDPSWEVKSDYETVPKLVGQLARKWNVGVIALWYPILAPHVAVAPAQRAMVRTLMADHPEALLSEVRFPPAREGHGMVGSGMVVLNPPWGLDEEAAQIGRRFAKL